MYGTWTSRPWLLKDGVNNVGTNRSTSTKDSSVTKLATKLLGTVRHSTVLLLGLLLNNSLGSRLNLLGGRLVVACARWRERLLLLLLLRRRVVLVVVVLLWGRVVVVVVAAVFTVAIVVLVVRSNRAAGLTATLLKDSNIVCWENTFTFVVHVLATPPVGVELFQNLQALSLVQWKIGGAVGVVFVHGFSNGSATGTTRRRRSVSICRWGSIASRRNICVIDGAFLISTHQSVGVATEVAVEGSNRGTRVILGRELVHKLVVETRRKDVRVLQKLELLDEIC